MNYKKLQIMPLILAIPLPGLQMLVNQDSLLKIKDPYTLSVKSTRDTIYVHQFQIKEKETTSIRRYLEFTEN